MSARPSDESEGLHALAAKCRERLDALPTWAQPSWYRLRANHSVPPASMGGAS